MKLSTRGQYGTRALLDLALHRDEKPVPLKDIAQRQDIPLQYLEHLITPLIAGGIIWSTRGARGGVSLARPLHRPSPSLVQKREIRHHQQVVAYHTVARLHAQPVHPIGGTKSK